MLQTLAWSVQQLQLHWEYYIKSNQFLVLHTLNWLSSKCRSMQFLYYFCTVDEVPQTQCLSRSERRETSCGRPKAWYGACCVNESVENRTNADWTCDVSCTCYFSALGSFTKHKHNEFVGWMLMGLCHGWSACVMSGTVPLFNTALANPTMDYHLCPGI